MYQINLTLTQIPWKINFQTQRILIVFYELYFLWHTRWVHLCQCTSTHCANCTVQNSAYNAFGFSSVLRCEEIYLKRHISESKYRYESDFSLAMWLEVAYAYSLWKDINFVVLFSEPVFDWQCNTMTWMFFMYSFSFQNCKNLLLGS